MKKVLIIKRYERDFRLPFYEKLYNNLKANNIDLELIIGYPNKYELINIKDYLVKNNFGKIKQNRYFYLGKFVFSFQNVFKEIKNKDLIILQQSNSEITNFILLILKYFAFNYKLAFWGHGINFQAKNKNNVAQKFKLIYSKYVDHWFAYNKKTKTILENVHYPCERITIVNNTLDFNEQLNKYESISEELNLLKKNYNIHDNDKVGVFCGSLYKLKRIEFLLDALIQIRKNRSDFHFFVLGKGDLEESINNFAKNNEEWFHYLGFLKNKEKLAVFKIADFQLIPGAVGLNIIDAFFTKTPLITTEDSNHGPEIDYLINGYNGIITKNNIDDYVCNINTLLNNESYLNKLKDGCYSSSKLYTMENMVDNFYNGIIKVLNG